MENLNYTQQKTCFCFFWLTFPDLQCSAANLVASRTQSTSIPSTCETKGNGGIKVQPRRLHRCRGTIQHFRCVCSIIHEHQTAGWMLTPATARTGSASSCSSLGSDRPAAAHGRDALQLLARTSAITHRTDNTTRVSL